MIEYIPWPIVGILFLLVLSLFIFIWKRPSTLNNTTDDLKGYSSDLKPLIQVFTNEIQGIRVSLEKIVEILENQVEVQPTLSQESEKVSTSDQAPQEPPQTLQTERSGEMSLALQQFCNAYNAGERIPYPQYCRISVKNARDRQQGSSEPPIFQESTKGKFYVYHIVEDDLYAVVPSSRVNQNFYSPGAFREVFDCSGFDPTTNSAKVILIRPAIFNLTSAKQKWTLEEKGKVELKAL